jgi:hypothetical protein
MLRLTRSQQGGNLLASAANPLRPRNSENQAEDPSHGEEANDEDDANDPSEDSEHGRFSNCFLMHSRF